MDTTSYWSSTASFGKHPQLGGNYEVDVAIIGAGITGITAAYLFKQSGCKVALIERGRCGGFDTVNTTAHVTHVTDQRLHRLVSLFGKDKAAAVWDAGIAAIDTITRNIGRENIRCEFDWVPGYLHAPLAGDPIDEIPSLKKDARLAEELGFAAEYLEAIPGLALPGVRFPHQAKFHPLKYLAGLVRTIPGKGSHVFEQTEVEEVSEKPLAVKAGKYKIRCRYVFVATHNPLMGKAGLVSAALFQTKLFLYTSYALGLEIPSGELPPACYWDTAEPYHYLRVDGRRGHDYAIFGGEDHKTGQVKNTVNIYQRLQGAFTHVLRGAEVKHRWSGQVIETPDGLPYIGEMAERQFVATGFGGNGITFGTLGAMMAVDAFLKRKNPWAELFDVNRKKIRGGTWNFLKENKDYPYYLIRDWLGGATNGPLESVRRNQGKILNLAGRKVAAYRNEEGELTLLSPVCTHLKCIVGWNNAEKTWDCPCHGSRFAATGEVLSGPAEEALEPLNAKKLQVQK